MKFVARSCQPEPLQKWLSSPPLRLIVAGSCVIVTVSAKSPVLSAASAPGQAVCQRRNIGGADAVTIFRQVEATHQPVSRAIAIGHHRTVTVTYDFTQQGNGTLSIANLLLRPYSEADAVQRYQGRALDVLLFPDAATGSCSIAVSGIIETTGEKDDAVIQRRPALAVYRLTKSGQFLREIAQQADLYDLTESKHSADARHRK